MSSSNFQHSFSLLFTSLLMLWIVLTPRQVEGQTYQRVLQDIEQGMDADEVISIAGQPTKMVEITRWFYDEDQVVIVDNQVVDIRIGQRVRPEKRSKNGQPPQRRISWLRVGMDEDEVLETSGNPDQEFSGTDLYYSNRHRVELTEGRVSKVDLHIKKGLDFLDWIRLNFSDGGLLFMNITLAFIMFGIALEIKLSRFKEIFTKPKSFILGFISQFILLPALTFVLVLIIKPAPSIALGMILVAACPGGNISNFISSIAKANVELSITLTAVATLTTIFMTPFNFWLWGGLYSGTADMIIPISIDVWEMMKTVFILLGIPIILGISFAAKFPKITTKIIKPFKIFSFIAFAGFVVAALAANFNFFLDYIHLIFLIVLAHNLLALTTGYSLSALFRLKKADQRTITIETGIQNSGLGLVLIFNPNLFDGLGGMAFVAAWWGIWHIISGLIIAFYWSKRPVS